MFKYDDNEGNIPSKQVKNVFKIQIRQQNSYVTHIGIANW